MFVDETGAKTNMARLRGRSLEGQRSSQDGVALGALVNTMAFVAVRRTTGLTAQILLDGAMNCDAFKCLCRVNGSLPACILETSSSWTIGLGPQGRMVYASRSRYVDAFLLYLPAYSPDLNPIGLAFTKLKDLHDRNVGDAGRIDELSQAITDIMEQFTPRECMNYIRRAGYDRPLS